MTQEEIIKLAHTAGFNWPDIQATTIEQRLERFASLVAATEREKFTNTQEFVTLPREVVELALEAMTAAMGAGPYKHRCSDAAEALRAALEQTKCEQEPVAWIENVEGGIGCNPYHEAARKLPDGVRFDLYAHPQNLRCKSNQARLATLWGYVKAEPPTDEQIDAMWQQSCREHFSGLQREIHLFRAIEATHNIK